jgi:hypothetical protein
LKGTRRRVLTGLAGPHGFAYKRGEFTRGCNRPLAPSSHNLLCNLESKPFFAIISYNLRNVSDLGSRQPLCRRLALRCIHAHVERRVKAETEAPLPLIKLRRRNSNIKEYAIDSVDSCLLQGLGQLAEAVVQHGQSLIVDCAGYGDRLRVTVEREKTSLRAELFENGATMTTATKSTVDVSSGGFYLQSLDRLPQ